MSLWQSIKNTFSKSARSAEQTQRETPPPGSAAKMGPGEEIPEWYVVQKGDTLSHLAKRFYGKASLYMKIFNANMDILKDPNKIKIGQKLRIPK